MIDSLTSTVTSASGAGLGVVPTATGAATPQAQPAQTSAAAFSQSSRAPAQAATRIYVDRTADGVYVYRLVDVASGRVLAELPRTDGGAPKLLAGYEPGAVASASA